MKSPAPRPSRNDPSNARRPGLAAQVELDARRRELFVAGGKARKLVNREALAHVPAAAPVRAVGPVRVRGRCRPDLEKHLTPLKLGGPGAVDVGRGLRGDRSRAGQDENRESGTACQVGRREGAGRVEWLVAQG